MIVTEGQLKGSIKGFHNRDTVFEFFGSGEKWKQDEYKYAYHYAYMPNAKVVDENGRYVIYIEGMNDSVAVRKV